MVEIVGNGDEIETGQLTNQILSIESSGNNNNREALHVTVSCI
jgi:hypothetical protein